VITNTIYMKFIHLLILLIPFTSCHRATSKLVDSRAPVYLKVLESHAVNSQSSVSGNVIDDINGEIIPFSTVILSAENKMNSGAITDMNGNFKIDKLQAGKYILKVSGSGFNSDEYVFLIKPNTAYQIQIKLQSTPIYLEKPVIYLYPTDKTEISVQLDYDGELIHSYPHYPKDGWKMIAEPNGTLWDEKGQEYYALFWEGKPNSALFPKDGFVIPGPQTASFLEEKLAELGLNRREANEFIMYWLPRMENNPYNLIHFAGDDYEKLAVLNIVPKPETMIRVMMLTQALDHKITFPLQDLTPLKKTRKGYTAVEWGGSVIERIPD
jgi:hypothetical protein